MNKEIFFKRKPERNLKIYDLYKEGMTYQKIGNRFKLSKQRVYRIILQVEKSKQLTK